MKRPAAAMAWLKVRAPGVHRFLTRTESPYPAVREALVGAFLVVAVLSLLWGYTGQPVNRSPIVVVESGSMMHCTNGFVPEGRDCHPTRYGRLGTIDPGDLILVKDTDGDDVEEYVAGGEHHYGRSGDVIVYRPDGSQQRTPIIHRVLFWLEVHGDGTYSVPELGIERVSSLDLPALRELGLRSGYAEWLRQAGAGPEDSGFITRGDNNLEIDQVPHGMAAGGIAAFPVQPQWILGMARGEIPWLGLVKLFVADLLADTTNFRDAGSDSKLLLVLSLGVLIGGPYAFEKWRASRKGPEAG